MQIVYIFETSISVDDFESVIEMYNIIASTFNVLTNNDNIGFGCTVAMALIPCLGEGGGWGTFCLGVDISPLFYLLYETLHRSF